MHRFLAKPKNQQLIAGQTPGSEPVPFGTGVGTGTGSGSRPIFDPGIWIPGRDRDWDRDPGQIPEIFKIVFFFIFFLKKT